MKERILILLLLATVCSMQAQNGSYIPPDPKPGGYNLCL